MLASRKWICLLLLALVACSSDVPSATALKQQVLEPAQKRCVPHNTSNEAHAVCLDREYKQALKEYDFDYPDLVSGWSGQNILASQIVDKRGYAVDSLGSQKFRAAMDDILADTLHTQIQQDAAAYQKRVDFVATLTSAVWEVLVATTDNKPGSDYGNCMKRHDHYTCASYVPVGSDKKLYHYLD